MEQLLTPALLNGVGVVGLVVGLFWMLSTGRLVTRREADGIKEERDHWRDAFESEQSSHGETISQKKELMEVARFGMATMGALRRGAEE